MKLHILYFFLIFSLFSCQNSHNEDETAEEQPTPTPKEIHTPKIEYGIVFDDYLIDSARVKKNEGLSHILPKYDISPAVIHTIAVNFDTVFDVRKIKPEHLYLAFLSKDSTHKLEKFVYQKNAVEYVVFDFKDSVNVYTGEKDITKKEQKAGGVVTSSLWNAFIDRGLSPALVLKVTKLYAWSIDFFGIQKGDYYKVTYDAKYIDNDKFVGIDEIKAVLFHHNGKDYYFFRYQNDTMPSPSYYSETGESMKRALLSAPLEYSRISSRFSHKRFHPVLKYYRPHHGVDYAAPSGTEVVATGNGIVIFAGWAGGAGRLVKIKHSTGDIITKYMHLRSFAKGIRKGAHVQQGQKIGEVGSSGVSTGPHLDYRIFIHGKPVDPLSLDIPTVEPLKDSALILFQEFIAPIKTQLDEIKIDTTTVNP